MIEIPGTDIRAQRPLVLGGNTFGWTSDEPTSFDVLDAFVDAGGSLIDTADAYSSWAPGNQGGESESIIGRWHRSRRHRDDIVIASKVSQHPDYRGLSPANIAAAADASLHRLGTDRIDLYYAHFDDETQSVEDMAVAFDALVRQGKVRYVALSNFSTGRARAWIELADRESLARPVALQPQYNLLHRGDVEDRFGPLARAAGLALFPYFSLAAGLLTGKYRTAQDLEDRARSGNLLGYLNGDDRRAAAFSLLGLERDIAATHGVSVTSVSLGWLLAKESVTAPIASARVPGHLPDLLAATDLTLSPGDLSALDRASDSFR